MAVAPQKADVTLAVAPEHQAAAGGLKAGATVQLTAAADGSGMDCSTADDAPLGRLPAADCPPLMRGAANSTVRSIRCEQGVESHSARYGDESSVLQVPLSYGCTNSADGCASASSESNLLSSFGGLFTKLEHSLQAAIS